MTHLLWGTILLFVLLLQSRKQYKQECKTREFLTNLLQLSRSKEKKAADPDTIALFLKKIPSHALEPLPAKLVNHLIRIKALDDYRFNGFFFIAIDGTGMFYFKKRHCKHCLTKKDKNHRTIYYHHQVLEAKLVTANGFAFSLASEFIENPQAFPKKQDCELNAFKRIVPKIKRYFPKLSICLLLDALYAKSPVFKLCEKNHWKYIITFKQGAMKTFYHNIWSQKAENLSHRKTIPLPHGTQRFAWVNHFEYKHYLLNVLFCNEFKSRPKKSCKDFAWITNFHELSDKNIKDIAQGGRLRWVIENEGFNVQKNGGYALEHAYSLDNNAMKNYYYLLQIAHALNQLMAKSNLFSDFNRQIGSLKNLAKRLAEHLRFLLIDPLIWNSTFQIRFNSA